MENALEALSARHLGRLSGLHPATTGFIVPHEPQHRADRPQREVHGHRDQGDDVVTPYTNALLPAASNVENVLLQNQCTQDGRDHISIAYDSNALADVVYALGPDNPNFVPTCQAVGPVFGNV